MHTWNNIQIMHLMKTRLQKLYGFKGGKFIFLFLIYIIIFIYTTIIYYAIYFSATTVG